MNQLVYNGLESKKIESIKRHHKNTVVCYNVDGTIKRRVFNITGEIAGTGIDAPTTMFNVDDCNIDNIVEVDVGSTADVGDYAFANCQSLTSVTITDDKTNIGDYAFYNCGNLLNITAKGGLSANSYSFFKCTKLSSIDTFENTFDNDPGYEYTVISSYGTGSFNDCTKLSGNFCFYTEKLAGLKGNNYNTIAFYDLQQASRLQFPIASGLYSSTYNGRIFESCKQLKYMSIPHINNFNWYVGFHVIPANSIVFDFRGRLPSEGIPSLESATEPLTTFASKVIVPTNMLEDWRAAAVWSSIANKITDTP